MQFQILAYSNRFHYSFYHFFSQLNHILFFIINKTELSMKNHHVASSCHSENSWKLISSAKSIRITGLCDSHFLEICIITFFFQIIYENNECFIFFFEKISLKNILWLKKCSNNDIYLLIILLKNCDNYISYKLLFNFRTQTIFFSSHKKKKNERKLRIKKATFSSHPKKP